jgi:hypothetical protein
LSIDYLRFIIILLTSFLIHQLLNLAFPLMSSFKPIPALLIILNSLLYFLLRIHYKRPMLHYRLIQRFPGKNNKPSFFRTSINNCHCLLALNTLKTNSLIDQKLLLVLNLNLSLIVKQKPIPI